MATEEIKIRIKKLLNLSRNNTNEAEAAAAAAKAQELLAQYNLAQADIEAIDPTQREGVDRFEWSALVYPNNKVMGWREDLFTAVCRTTWCQVYVNAKAEDWRYDSIGRWRAKRSREAWVVGRKTDVEIAEYLFTYLTREIEQLAEAATRNFGRQVYRGAKTKYRMGFLKGASEIVTDRLLHQWRENQKSEQQMHALVLVRGKEVQDYLDKHVGQLSSKKTYRVVADGTGRLHGQQAGRDIDLNRGIEAEGRRGLPG